ncbi:asparagine synthetase B family protein [Tistrella mobilis]|uniref:asparagine synthetase B family protein n=1 Tax=Tistrella mobilis TaxID=171437 RepID=UPI003559361F
MSALLGIIGFADPLPRDLRLDGLGAMLPAVTGRDGEWRSGQAVLAWRGFVVTPQDRIDRQPMTGGAGRLIAVFDGRLDAREALARQLDLPEGDALAMPDGQLFLKAFEAWGTGAFARLYGDFACAVWDDQDRRLVLGCDAIGARPLVWRRDGHVMRFASRPAGLFADPDVPRDLDEDNLIRICGRLPIHPTETIYRGVRAVPGGTHLVADRDGVRLHRHWRPGQVKRFTLASDRDYEESFRSVLETAVADRMRSTKPVASHLSAGFDSSTVTAVAARRLAASGRRLTAYTAAPAVGYTPEDAASGALFDESEGAAAVAALHPNIDHVVIRAGHRSPLDGLDRFRLGADRPPHNPVHMVWLDAIARDAAGRGAGVLLHAAAGNATISYDGLHQLGHLILRGRLIAALREARGVKIEYGSYRLQADALTRALIDRFGLGRRLKRVGFLRRLKQRSMIDSLSRLVIPVREEVRAAIPRADWQEDWFDRRVQEDGGYRADLAIRPIYAALSFYDEAVHGIATRDPTADRRVIEFCWGVPLSVWLRDGLTRRLTRNALAGLLPPAVLGAHRTARQAADWHVGLTAARDEMRAEVEAIGRSDLARRILDVDELQRLLDDWPEGNWHRREVRTLYQAKLLNGIAAGQFIRRMTGGNL